MVLVVVANAYKDMQYIVEMDKHEGFHDSALNAVVLQIFHDAVEEGTAQRGQCLDAPFFWGFVACCTLLRVATRCRAWRFAH